MSEVPRVSGGASVTHPLLQDPAVRSALDATRHTYQDGTKTSGYFLNDENIIPLVTALCAWQRAQDIQALREEAARYEGLVNEASFPSAESISFHRAADHLEALK